MPRTWGMHPIRLSPRLRARARQRVRGARAGARPRALACPACGRCTPSGSAPACALGSAFRFWGLRMNKPVDVNDLAFEKFAVGQPAPRNEDATLVQGGGCYTDDQALPGQAWGAFLRSPYAH